MSDTKRRVQPGWNSTHRWWPARFGDMSEKMQGRDLRAKNEALAAAELSDEETT